MYKVNINESSELSVSIDRYQFFPAENQLVIDESKFIFKFIDLMTEELQGGDMLDMLRFNISKNHIQKLMEIVSSNTGKG